MTRGSLLGSSEKMYVQSELRTLTLSRDSIENVLLKHRSSLERKSGWVAPLSMALSLSGTLAGVETWNGEVWPVVIYAAWGVSILWFIAAFCYAVMNWNNNIERVMSLFDGMSEQIER
jgi:hypothetical protein